jgi:lysozyme family protein
MNSLATVLGQQQALNFLAQVEPPLVEDGVMGPKTVAAIKSYQYGNLEMSADDSEYGRMGPRTAAALQVSVNAEIANQKAGAPPSAVDPPSPVPRRTAAKPAAATHVATESTHGVVIAVGAAVAVVVAWMLLRKRKA